MISLEYKYEAGCFDDVRKQKVMCHKILILGSRLERKKDYTCCSLNTCMVRNPEVLCFCIILWIIFVKNRTEKILTNKKAQPSFEKYIEDRYSNAGDWALQSALEKVIRYNHSDKRLNVLSKN